MSTKAECPMFPEGAPTVRNGTGWWVAGILAALLLGMVGGEFLPNRNVVTSDQLQKTDEKVDMLAQQVAQTNKRLDVLVGEMRGKKEIGALPGDPELP